MSKVKEWEYDDVMHDYLQWQDELERLLDEDEPDEDAPEQWSEIKEKYVASNAQGRTSKRILFRGTLKPEL